MNQESQTIDYTLRTVWSSVCKMYNNKAKEYNFTMVSGFALLSIDPKNGTLSTSLGPKMGLKSTSLSRILKKLEQDNFIEKQNNTNDKRLVYIHLTQKGKEYRNHVKKYVLEFNENIKNTIPKDKMDIFHEVINTIQQKCKQNIN